MNTTGAAIESIRVLIVDDEPIARNTLRLLLGKHKHIHIVDECSGVDAPAAIRRASPQIVFLDVQMPELDGFGVIDDVGVAAIPVVVFVTAYDQHALRAFEVHAFDYLLKPFDDARFERTLQRAIASLKQPDEAQRAANLLTLLQANGYAKAGRYLRRLSIREAERVSFVAVEQVDWIEAHDYYVRLHVGKSAHLLRQTMAELEQRLDPDQFFRIHRSAIVNLDRVRELRPLFKGDYSVLLTDGTDLRIGRGRCEELQRRLQG